MRKITKSLLASSILAALLAVGMSAIGNTTMARLQAQAESGDAASMRHLGEVYLAGIDVPRDVDAGVQWLTATIDSPNVPDSEAMRAHYRLALHFEQLPHTPLNQEQMVKHYRQAAELGHTTAQTRIGDILLERSDDMALSAEDRTRAREQGLKLYRHAADAKNGYALWRMSQLVAEGRHLPKDDSLAISYARQASEARSPAATMYVANYYLADPRSKQFNEVRGIYYLKRGADLNDAQAHAALALRRLEGRGVPKDLDAAERNAKAAQSRGLATAAGILERVRTAKADAQRDAEEADMIAASNAREEERLKQQRFADEEAIAKLEAEKMVLQVERTKLAKTTPEVPALEQLPLASIEPVPAPAPARIVEEGDTLTALSGDPVVSQLNDRLNQLDSRLSEVEEESRALRAQLADRDARIASITAERDAALSALASAEQAMTNAIAAIRSGRDVSAIAQATPAPTAAPVAKPVVTIVPTDRDADAWNRNGLLAARTQRFDAAIDYFKKASAKGHGGAMNNLGMLTMRGQGVRANLSVAMRHFEKAAELGTAAAANNLAYMHLHGVGVTASRGKAIEWYKRAVALGSADAQRELVALGVLPDQQSIANR